MAKSAMSKPKNRSKYDEKLDVKGSFLDTMLTAAKNASYKSVPKNSITTKSYHNASI